MLQLVYSQSFIICELQIFCICIIILHNPTGKVKKNFQQPKGFVRVYSQSIVSVLVFVRFHYNKTEHSKSFMVRSLVNQ